MSKMEKRKIYFRVRGEYDEKYISVDNSALDISSAIKIMDADKRLDNNFTRINRMTGESITEWMDFSSAIYDSV